MKKNKFFVLILLGSVLFSDMSFSMEPEQNLSNKALDLIKSSFSTASRVIGRATLITAIGVAATFALLYGVVAAERLSRPAGNVFHVKFGPYLSTYFSYFKQIESGLNLIKAEKEQQGEVYSTEDCFADVAKIFESYNKTHVGSGWKSYNREGDIRKNVLYALLHKYELCLPENITKQEWIDFSQNNEVNLSNFKEASLRYKSNETLNDAIAELGFE